MRPLLLQIDSADPHYHGMIEDNRARCAAYAEKQGYVYFVVDAPTDDFRWFRIEAIAEALKTEAPYVFYLDADTAIADFNADMRDTVPEPTWLGLTVHPFPWGNNSEWHLNTGVIYVRNCDEAKQYFDDVLAAYKPGTYDQMPMNDLLVGDNAKYHGVLNILDRRWNDCLHQKGSKNPVVAAWHGHMKPEYRRFLMASWSAEHPYA